MLVSGFIDADQAHQLSLRYDWLKADYQNVLPNRTPVDKIGNAWTLAYSYRPSDQHRLSFEFLSVESRRSARISTGISARQRDTTFQTNYRFTI